MSRRADVLLPSIAVVCAASWAVSCAVVRDEPPPGVELPESLEAEAAELPSLDPSSIELSEWWRKFEDEDLNRFVERALEHNQDLRNAEARLEQAAALSRSSLDHLPRADLRAGAGRSQTSDRSAFPRFDVVDRRNSTYSVGFDLAYEVDLWGRVRAGDRAVLADLEADRESLLAMRASVASSTAQAYFRLVALDARIRLLERTRENRSEALQIQERRESAGTGTGLEVAQARAELASVEVLLPRALESRAAAERALEVLAGSAPRQIAAPRPARGAALPEPPPVPAGLPSELLERRPDVRSARAFLAARSARVSEARARLYPRLTLTGAFGQETRALEYLFVSPANVWNFAAGLTQPLFGLRKLRAEAEGAEAGRRAAEATYVHTLQIALAETLDALGALRATRETLPALDRRIEALEETGRIASARHTAGTGTFLEQLDASRDLLQAEDARIELSLDTILGTIDVFRALGGGFEREEESSAPAK